MKTAHSSIAQVLPDGAPEWIHLVPAGTFSGADGRGPYTLGDASAVIAASMTAGRKLPIDENHSIDLQAKTGGSTPARGWIVEMDARDDGIWGRVEWTGEGRSLVEGRSYGFLSPVFLHGQQKPHRVAKILRAALTNDPNLTTLTSLHTNGADPVEEELKTLFGLASTASTDDVLKAVKAAHAAQTSGTALMARHATAAGVAATATADELVTAINSKGATEGATVAELRTQVTSLNTQLTQVVTTHAKKTAETVVDAAIAAGKTVPAMRDRLIARHMKDPAEVDEELALMPSLLGKSLAGFRPTDTKDGALSDEDAKVCALMGVDPAEFAKTAATMTRGA